MNKTSFRSGQCAILCDSDRILMCGIIMKANNKRRHRIMNMVVFIMILTILLTVHVMASSTAHWKTVEGHIEDHHRMQRMLQSVKTFSDRDTFHAAVDEQLADQNRTSFFEDFSSFAGMPDMRFDNAPLIIPALSSGLPEVFTLEGTPGNFFFVSTRGFFDAGIFGKSASFTITPEGPGFIRFPEPGVTAFFADFAGTNNIPEADTTFELKLAMQGTEMVQVEQLILPVTTFFVINAT